MWAFWQKKASPAPPSPQKANYEESVTRGVLEDNKAAQTKVTTTDSDNVTAPVSQHAIVPLEEEQQGSFQMELGSLHTKYQSTLTELQHAKQEREDLKQQVPAMIDCLEVLKKGVQLLLVEEQPREQSSERPRNTIAQLTSKAEAKAKKLQQQCEETQVKETAFQELHQHEENGTVCQELMLKQHPELKAAPNASQKDDVQQAFNPLLTLAESANSQEQEIIGKLSEDPAPADDDNGSSDLEGGSKNDNNDHGRFGLDKCFGDDDGDDDELNDEEVVAFGDEAGCDSSNTNHATSSVSRSRGATNNGTARPDSDAVSVSSCASDNNVSPPHRSKRAMQSAGVQETTEDTREDTRERKRRKVVVQNGDFVDFATSGQSFVIDLEQLLAKGANKMKFVLLLEGRVKENITIPMERKETYRFETPFAQPSPNDFPSTLYAESDWFKDYDSLQTLPTVCPVCEGECPQKKKAQSNYSLLSYHNKSANNTNHSTCCKIWHLAPTYTNEITIVEHVQNRAFELLKKSWPERFSWEKLQSPESITLVIDVFFSDLMDEALELLLVLASGCKWATKLIEPCDETLAAVAKLQPSEAVTKREKDHSRSSKYEEYKDYIERGKKLAPLMEKLIIAIRQDVMGKWHESLRATRIQTDDEEQPTVARFLNELLALLSLRSTTWNPETYPLAFELMKEFSLLDDPKD